MAHLFTENKYNFYTVRFHKLFWITCTSNRVLSPLTEVVQERAKFVKFDEQKILYITRIKTNARRHVIRHIEIE
jgi:hypothetical protein